MKIVGCKSALNATVDYSTDRFKGVVPVLVLLFVPLLFILRGDLSLAFCNFVIVFVSRFRIAISTLGGRES